MSQGHVYFFSPQIISETKGDPMSQKEELYFESTSQRWPCIFVK